MLNYHRERFRKLTFRALALRQSIRSDEGLTLETIRIAIVIESVKESASGTGIGAITTGVNARATRISTDRKTTIGSGATEAMRDPLKVLILRFGRRCDTKVNIIIISFYFF